MYPREASFEKRKAAAESGDPKAAFYLGWCYYTGNNVAKDKTEAWKWYSKAASQGVREAAEMRRILELEAQRELQLAVLRETILNPRKRLPVWLLLICAILVSAGTIGAVFHVLNGRSNTGELSAPEGEKTIKAGAGLHPANQLSGDPAGGGQATATRDDTRSEDSTRASVAGHGSGGVPTNQGDADSAVVVKPRAQPNDPKRSSGHAIDLNEWAERAMRWLADGNDPYNPSRPSEAADQKHGQE